jgi:hypothetical protein
LPAASPAKPAQARVRQEVPSGKESSTASKEGSSQRLKRAPGTPDFEITFEQRVEQYQTLQRQQLPAVTSTSSLQPSTPPLTPPTGASPASRPASVSGEASEDSCSTARDRTLPPEEVAESVRAALESKLRCALA